MGTALVWFRNDLRLHDNLVMAKALAYHDAVFPVYVFEDFYWQKDQFGHTRTGPFRTALLVSAVAELRDRLRRIGSELVVRRGTAPEVIGQLAADFEVEAVYSSQEVAAYETQTEEALFARLPVPYHTIWQATLYHPEDLPFDPEATPDVYTNFRKKCEKYGTVQAPLAAPDRVPTPMVTAPGALPDPEALNPVLPPQDERVVLDFKGGETRALDRLHYYIWDTHYLARYKQTRNGLIGPDYSSKFSAWLNLGCLSPRQVHQEVKAFEASIAKNKSTYWLIFELIWRDFFRFLSLRYGNKIFYRTGLWDVEKLWYEHPEHFQAWQEGFTGVPFIDANMREIYQTGYMSNRGRQNVAAFLAKDLQIDWRKGASWFESLLVDYDVHSNWGNWNYNAGVGSDPRNDRHFNVVLQAKKYDKKAEYIKLWIPELAHLDAENILNWPMLSNNQQQDLAPDYPAPVFVHKNWYNTLQS